MEVGSLFFSLTVVSRTISPVRACVCVHSCVRRAQSSRLLPAAQQPKSRESCRRRSGRYRDVLVLEYQGREVRSSRRGSICPVWGTQGGLSVGSKGAHGERGVWSYLGTWDFPDLLPRRWWLRAGGRRRRRRRRRRTADGGRQGLAVLREGGGRGTCVGPLVSGSLR